jgi:hypothetical protein
MFAQASVNYLGVPYCMTEAAATASKAAETGKAKNGEAASSAAEKNPEEIHLGDEDEV